MGWVFKASEFGHCFFEFSELFFGWEINYRVRITSLCLQFIFVSFDSDVWEDYDSSSPISHPPVKYFVDLLVLDNLLAAEPVFQDEDEGLRLPNLAA
jgi:hypothetical protein